MAERGRPSSYDPAMLPKIEEMAKAGATDEELADYIGVSVNTVYRWKNEHRDFRYAIKAGKAEADERVERSLYRRALGYEIDSVKIFCDAKTGEVTQVPYKEYIQPSDTAAIFWLKNRKKEEWRDKIETEHTGSVGVQLLHSIPRPDREEK
jgi:transcriptional regulator with XRE-family HTH domain